MANTRFVKYEELTSFGVPKYSRAWLIELQKRGQFPQARQISANRIAWLARELEQWLKSRPVVQRLPDEPQ